MDLMYIKKNHDSRPVHPGTINKDMITSRADDMGFLTASMRREPMYWWTVKNHLIKWGSYNYKRGGPLK
ncbi:hypothetical protein DNK57_01595 [Methanothermobacter thermautotrophicus]|uniref:Uncharacterized protein n=1 Tax=Methanothermobacter thermautotrophicus TaxID=145262 RepID=A0A842YNH2_METTF|nr:hypothetical protein [Methanothermobacter thermautotrophicus]